MLKKNLEQIKKSTERLKKATLTAIEGAIETANVAKQAEAKAKEEIYRVAVLFWFWSQTSIQISSEKCISAFWVYLLLLIFYRTNKTS